MSDSFVTLPLAPLSQTQPPAQPFARFVLVWFGQLVSQVGSSLSDFALTIWVYKTTSSVFLFGLMLLASVLPRLLVSPFAGVVVDRWNRRNLMLLADLVHAVLTLGVLVLAYFNVLQPWHLIAITVLSSITATFQYPAYQALIPQMVREKDLGRANGMGDFSMGLSQLVGPLLGGLLLASAGLSGVVLVDLLTFVVAAAATLLVRVPNVAPVVPTSAPGQQTDLRSEFLAGWQFIRQRPGLLRLMLYIAGTVFLVSFMQVLTPPLVLGVSDERTLGIILTAGGLGLLLGGLLMSAWGGPKPRIYGLLIFDLLTAAAMVMAGLQTSLVWLSVVAFLFFFGMPVSRSSAQAVWQSVVPQHLQGRVFTARDMIAIGASPIALLIAGPLADGIFEPLLQPNGVLANVVGPWIGVGPGRGIALLFIVLGAVFFVVNAVAWRSRQLRTCEEPLASTT